MCCESTEHLDLPAEVIGIVCQTTGAPLRHTATISDPTWIAAVARGPGHPEVLDASALAHTSPVYVDLDGRRVGRERDARWCLGLLDRLATLIEEHGHFHPAHRDSHLDGFRSLLDEARQVYQEVIASAQE